MPDLSGLAIRSHIRAALDDLKARTARFPSRAGKPPELGEINVIVEHFMDLRDLARDEQAWARSVAPATPHERAVLTLYRLGALLTEQRAAAVLDLLDPESKTPIARWLYPNLETEAGKELQRRVEASGVATAWMLAIETTAASVPDTGSSQLQ